MNRAVLQLDGVCRNPISLGDYSINHGTMITQVPAARNGKEIELINDPLVKALSSAIETSGGRI
jgi:hypothetical protein